MRIGGRFLVYVAAVHLIVAAAFMVLLWERRVWLLAVELFTAVSLLIAWRLARQAAEPARLIETGVQLVAGGDFTTRFEERGRPELDVLIRVYNRMVDDLRRERVRNEEQESFLRRIMEVSPQGIVTLDHDGRVAAVNPGAAELLGCPPDALQGARLADLESPLARELAALGVGETRVVPAKSGRRLRCQMGSFMDRGFPRGFYQIVELTEELRRGEKEAYGKLIRMMAHEVNNTAGAVGSLLRSCLRYAEQIAPADRSDFEGAVDVATRRIEHMNGFMKRFADVVRIPPPTPRDCDLPRLLEGLARLMAGEADRHGITLRVEIAAGPPLARADPDLLEQALVNILRNAMEAVERDGQIALRLYRDGAGRVLEVEDSGPGLPAGARERLFTPFFTTKEQGQGIGLTVVREILDGHGFAFDLDGPPGGPTRFRIFLGS